MGGGGVGARGRKPGEARAWTWGQGSRAPPNVFSGLSQAPSLAAETAAAACWAWLRGISKVNVTGVALAPTESTVGLEGSTLSSKQEPRGEGRAGERTLVQQERRSPWGVRAGGCPEATLPERRARDRARGECSRQKEQSG